MSSFYKLEYCTACGQMTNHTWHDNVPARHKYTAECMKCGLRTPEEDMVLPPTNQTDPLDEILHVCPDCSGDGMYAISDPADPSGQTPIPEQCMRCQGFGYHADKAAINAELIKARLVELDLLEQALNEGRDIAAFKLQRLKDLTERLDG